MGLAAPKNRTRISHDPQNTTWANNTSRFGHRILTSRGWTPGSSLGAQNAKHSTHYTAASHSHIRVLLKDDNLGLGAKRGSEHAENFGLAGLENVLGRLNGRAEEVKKEEERRDGVEKRRWVVNRYGFMNFVFGGFLVGGDIVSKEEVVKAEREIKIEVKEEDVEMKIEDAQERKEKKRKRSRDDKDVTEDRGEQPRLKRKKKSIDLKAVAAADEAAEKEKSIKPSFSDPDTTVSSPGPLVREPPSDRAKRKAEKRARKEEKKLKKALKKAAKDAAKSNPTQEAAASPSSEGEESETTPSTSTPTTGTSTPITSAGLTFAGGRHAARAKFIRSKKMAGMDAQALKEIFMIKTPS
ncbi:hypothetical protein CC78DRAFT_531739 [Lojkania enalia]|uniref:PinX1-related protein 1 n=1 Tax=Lojkania enalia TaxID=147567 RepID=A0A9P4KEE0_9PLEO|nr:hypothetical protein CC78DRAFT_531739 [Didymosphaeria enalia]